MNSKCPTEPVLIKPNNPTRTPPHGHRGKEDYFSETLFLDRPERKSLAFVIRPIESQELAAGGALVTVYDPVNRPLPSAEHIAAYFSLTQAEAQVCEGLIKGMDVQEVSAHYGRAVSTVRFQIKQVFQKTGCSRQGGLISRILSALLR
ncbi:helix-turn-helix transcriptional regulator [Marinobacter sp. 1Y8]